MTILLKYKNGDNLSRILILISNYLKKQNVDIRIEEDDKTILINSQNNSMEDPIEILIFLGKLGKNLLGKDFNLENDTREIIKKLMQVSFELKQDLIMEEFNNMIKNKSFFLGRSLTLVDLVIYISLYSYFKSLLNESESYTPLYQNLSTFFMQIQLITQIRQSCPEDIVYLDVPFFEKKLVKKDKEKKIVESEKKERPLDDPTRIALKVGKILSVERHPTADKLYLEKIDLGEEEPRTILSGLVGTYDLTQKVNELVVVVANLKPRSMRGITSNGMLLCASIEIKDNEEDKDGKFICEPVSVPKGAKIGELIRYEHFNGEPDNVLSTKTGKDPFAVIQPFYNVDNECICRFKEHSLLTSAGPIYVENKSLINGKLS